MGLFLLCHTDIVPLLITSPKQQSTSYPVYYFSNKEVALQNVFMAASSLLALGLIWSFWQLNRLNRRLNAALGGNKDPDSLEQQLSDYAKRVEAVDNRLDKLNQAYSKLEVTSSLASQKISVVRFNPFGDTGGDQSFTLAVLDAHNSGYVLTSIHGREGTRVYVKPIDYGQSKYQLSNEEKQAFTQASKRVPNLQGENDNG